MFTSVLRSLPGKRGPSIVLALLISFALPYPISTLASGESIAGISTASAMVNTASPIPGLVVVATGNPTLDVRLQAGQADLSMTNIAGLTFTGPTSGPLLMFNGTKDDINAALSTLTYLRTNGIGSDTVEISLVGAGYVFNPINGHMYEYVDATGMGGIDWPTAEAAAAARSLGGYAGYLVTVTSQAESDYITPRIEGSSWLGGSDSAVEGEWRWVTGPEAGTQFWQGDMNGSVVSGGFANWHPGLEPNNMGGEDCAQFLTGSGQVGYWNDLPCDSTALLDGYVVEYGNVNGAFDIAYRAVTVTTTAPTTQVASCAAFQALDDVAGNYFNTIELQNDIDCQGFVVEPLFSQHGEVFQGTLDGNGYALKNIVIDLPSDSDVGIIGEADGATIKDLRIIGGSVEGEEDVGGLVGQGENLTIQNVSSNLTVAGEEAVGGLVGDMEVSGADLVISGNSTTGSVSGEYDVGGLFGSLDIEGPVELLISKNFTTGNIETEYFAGGLFGRAYYAAYDGDSVVSFVDNYTWGDARALYEYAGGIGGLLEFYASASLTEADFTLRNAYSSGDVTADYYAGGIFGGIMEPDVSNQEVVVEKVFAAGAISAPDGEEGAIFGNVSTQSYDITSSDLYYDATRTGMSDCTSSVALSGCTAVNVGGSSPSYFFGNTTNPPLSSWNFTTIWLRNSGDYPTFRGADDADGIAPEVEDAGPNQGDANNDGVLDSQQAYVTSYLSQVTQRPVVLQVSSQCSITSTDVMSASQASRADVGYQYPQGLLRFAASCGAAGYTATITQYYFGISDTSLAVRKYHPERQVYFAVPGATVQQVMIGGQTALKVTYTVSDGSDMDTDGLVNGSIADPVGLGTVSVNVPATGFKPQ